ncbi:MAG TPA: NUDIX domain-containing protein [Acidimicrobiales bacterium]|nr:NUDIX domain-containing protein [Acidimicrobiales bacterium]
MRLAYLAKSAVVRMARLRTHGVAAIVVDGDGRVCMVRHTYMRGWFLPGGGRKRRESSEEAAVREVREEAGIEVVPGGIRHLEAYVLGRRNHVELYEITGWRQIEHHSSEIADVRFVDPAQLPPGASRDTRRRVGRWRADRQA